MDANILEKVAAAAAVTAGDNSKGAPASKAALQQGAPMPLASVAALASKVLLEQSQEAAAAGQRMVLAADKAHTTVLTDAKHRKSSLATEKQMEALASKDEAEGAAARKKAAKADKDMHAAEEARAGHVRKAESALSSAVAADQESASKKEEARVLAADAGKETRLAEISKADEARVRSAVELFVFLK
jgi:hypothetical protein